eukprot:505858_1
MSKYIHNGFNNWSSKHKYMTGNFYLCSWITKGDYDIWMQKHMNINVINVQEMVVDHLYIVTSVALAGNNDNFKPSIGLQHQFCVCYNPTNNGLYSSVIMDIETYNTQINILENETSTDTTTTTTTTTASDNNNNIIYLSNEDFLYGTYRIIESGIYILTENILSNFNTP